MRNQNHQNKMKNHHTVQQNFSWLRREECTIVQSTTYTWQGTSLEGPFGPHQFCGSGLPDGNFCDDSVHQNLCGDCTNEVLVQLEITSDITFSFCGCVGDGYVVLPQDSDKCCSGFVDESSFNARCAPPPVLDIVLDSF